MTRKRDRETGLNNVHYHISDKKILTIEDARLTVLNIYLECNKTLTPWCDCDGVTDTTNKRNKDKKL